MGLSELKADIKLARELVASATTVEELKQQLLDNVLPLMEGLVDSTREELASRDEVIQTVVDDIEELIDQSGDTLHPETAQKILMTLQAGVLLAAELELLLKKADDVTKKRVMPLVKGYRQGVLVVGEMISEITIPVDEEGDEVEGLAKIGPEDEEDLDDVDEDDEDDDEEDLEDDAATGKAR